MAKQVINIGTVANDGTGDPLRTAFDKVNDNFTELYNDDAGDVDSVNGQTGVVVLDTDDISEGATNKYLSADSVTNSEIGIRYKGDINVGALTSGTTTLDFSNDATFIMSNDTTATLTFSNLAAGDVKNLLITAGASGTSTLAFDTSFGGGRLVGTGEYDPTAAAVNFIQVVMVTPSTAYISISQSPSSI